MPFFLKKTKAERNKKKVEDSIKAVQRTIYSELEWKHIYQLNSIINDYIDNLSNIELSNDKFIQKRLDKLQRIKSNQRSSFPQKFRLLDKVKEMSVKSPYQEWLLVLTLRFKPKRILELGTGFGISTACFLQAISKNRGAIIDTVENWELPQSYNQKILKRYPSYKYNRLNLDIDKSLNELLRKNKYDLVFHDARHIGKKVMEDLIQIIKYLPSGGVVILDDITWSSGMKKMWEDIIKLPEISEYFTVDFRGYGFGKGILLRA